jgi:hypothetical protein
MSVWMFLGVKFFLAGVVVLLIWDRRGAKGPGPQGER